MRQYLKVYGQFFATSLSESMSFRLNFIFITLFDMVLFGTALGGVEIIYQSIDQIGSWTKHEFQFFLVFVMLVEYIHMTFASPNFWNFSHIMTKGELDLVLLKPMSSLFSVFFRSSRVETIPSAFVVLGFLIYYGFQIPLGGLSWFLLPVFVIASFIFLVTFEILIMCAAFWLVESFGLNFIRIQFQSLARWPEFIYGQFLRRTLTYVLPVLVFGNVPVKILLDPFQVLPWGFLFVGLQVLILIMIQVLWRAGLRRYESASS